MSGARCQRESEDVLLCLTPLVQAAPESRHMSTCHTCYMSICSHISHVPETRHMSWIGDLKARAKVDAALDWHHGNLRKGSAGLMFQKVFSPFRGQPPVKELVRDSENALHQSLKVLMHFLCVWRAPILPCMRGVFVSGYGAFS